MKAPEHESLASHTQDGTGAAADPASRSQPYLNGRASDLVRPEQSFTSQDSAGSQQGHHATPLLHGEQGTSEGAREVKVPCILPPCMLMAACGPASCEWLSPLSLYSCRRALSERRPLGADSSHWGAASGKMLTGGTPTSLRAAPR